MEKPKNPAKTGTGNMEKPEKPSKNGNESVELFSRPYPRILYGKTGKTQQKRERIR
jgi:hypothetical protein